MPKAPKNTGRIISEGDLMIAKAKHIQRQMHEFIEFFELAISSARSDLPKRKK